MQKKYTTKSATETVNLGEKYGATLVGGDLVLLHGDLGAGKTQFTKGIARALGITETVTSPTFTIERVYSGKRFVLHHLDLYRTKDDREILEQISELARSPLDVTVIEWPENMTALKSFNHKMADFVYTDDDERVITFAERGDKWS